MLGGPRQVENQLNPPVPEQRPHIREALNMVRIGEGLRLFGQRVAHAHQLQVMKQGLDVLKIDSADEAAADNAQPDSAHVNHPLADVTPRERAPSFPA